MKLPPQIKVLFFPVALVVLVIFLYLIAFRVGYSQVARQMDELKEAEKNEVVLEQKLRLLGKIQEEVLSQADTAVVALPDANPGLTMLGQLSQLATENGLTIGSKKIGAASEDSQGLSKIKVSLDITAANLSSVLEFVSAIGQIAPLSTLNFVEISKEGTGEIFAIVDLSTYWAPFPEKIPPLTAPIKELTRQEQEILARLSTLDQPQVAEAPAFAPSEVSERPDPFSL